MSAPSCFALDFAYAFCVVLFEFDAFCVCVTLPPVASPEVAPELCSGSHGVCDFVLLPYDGFSHGFDGFVGCGCLQQPPPAVASPVVASPPTPFCALLVRLTGVVLVPGPGVTRAVRVRLLDATRLAVKRDTDRHRHVHRRDLLASDFAEAFCVVSFEFDAFCDCETSPPVASPLVASPEVAPGLCSGSHGVCDFVLLPYDGFSHGFVGFGCVQQPPPVVASPVVASPP